MRMPLETRDSEPILESCVPGHQSCLEWIVVRKTWQEVDLSFD